MKNMNRNEFLKTSMKAGAFITLAQLGGPLLAIAEENRPQGVYDAEFMINMHQANDKRVAALLQSDRGAAGRALGHNMGFLAAAYASEASKYYHDKSLIPPMQKLVDTMFSFQSADGTLNFGNLESPPDTAFMLES